MTTPRFRVICGRAFAKTAGLAVVVAFLIPGGGCQGKPEVTKTVPPAPSPASVAPAGATGESATPTGAAASPATQAGNLAASTVATDPGDADPTFVKQVIMQVASRAVKGRDVLVRLTVDKQGWVTDVEVEKSGMDEVTLADLKELVMSVFVEDAGARGKRVPLMLTGDDLELARVRPAINALYRPFFMLHALPAIARRVTRGNPLRLRVTVGGQGRAEDAVVESEGLGPEMAASMRDQLKAMVFDEPAVRGREISLVFTGFEVDEARRRPDSSATLRTSFLRRALPSFAAKINGRRDIDVRLTLGARGDAAGFEVENSGMTKAAVRDVSEGFKGLRFDEPSLFGRTISMKFTADEIENAKPVPNEEADQYRPARVDRPGARDSSRPYGTSRPAYRDHRPSKFGASKRP